MRKELYKSRPCRALTFTGGLLRQRKGSPDLPPPFLSKMANKPRSRFTEEDRIKDRKQKKEWYQRHKEEIQKRRKIYYGLNPEKEKRKSLGGNRLEIKNWWVSFKASLKCSQCEESHPACLDFHHITPSEKEDRVANLVNYGLSKEKILNEIGKCVVLCSNCHRKLHYEQKNGNSH